MFCLQQEEEAVGHETNQIPPQQWKMADQMLYSMHTDQGISESLSVSTAIHFSKNVRSH